MSTNIFIYKLHIWKTTIFSFLFVLFLYLLSYKCYLSTQVLKLNALLKLKTYIFMYIHYQEKKKRKLWWNPSTKSCNQADYGNWRRDIEAMVALSHKKIQSRRKIERARKERRHVYTYIFGQATKREGKDLRILFARADGIAYTENNRVSGIYVCAWRIRAHELLYSG